MTSGPILTLADLRTAGIVLLGGNEINRHDHLPA